MKKTILILFVMIIAASCFALTGCGGSSDDGSAAAEEASAPVSEYVGTWKAVSVELKDKKADLDEALEEDFIIVLNEDGTAKISSEDGQEEAKWFENDKGFRVQGVDSETDLKINKDKNGRMVLSFVGVHLVFEKQ